MTLPCNTYEPQTLIAVQSLCTAFFLWDVVDDLGPNGLRAPGNPNIAIATLAALALVSAIIYDLRALMALLRCKAHLEDQVSIVADAFHDVMLKHFHHGALPPPNKISQGSPSRAFPSPRLPNCAVRPKAL